MGSRGSEFRDDGVKKNQDLGTIQVDDVNRLIDDLISASGKNTKVVYSYLTAIDKRNKEDVMKLDQKLKEGTLVTGENQQKIMKLRKELLSLAKDSPNDVSKILETTKQKLKDQINKLPPAQKAKYYEKVYKGKKFKLKNDVEVGHDLSKIQLYEPAGTEVGTLLKVKPFAFGGTYVSDGKVIDSGIPYTVNYQFLMDKGNGYTKWYSLRDLELIKE